MAAGAALGALTVLPADDAAGAEPEPDVVAVPPAERRAPPPVVPDAPVGAIRLRALPCGALGAGAGLALGAGAGAGFALEAGAGSTVGAGAG